GVSTAAMAGAIEATIAMPATINARMGGSPQGWRACNDTANRGRPQQTAPPLASGRESLPRLGWGRRRAGAGGGGSDRSRILTPLSPHQGEGARRVAGEAQHRRQGPGRRADAARGGAAGYDE